MAWSNRFGRRVPHVLDVPGRTAIEIHAGNDSTDTHGCILLGMRATPTALVDSNAAVHAFCVQLEADPEQHAYLQVLDHQATA